MMVDVPDGSSYCIAAVPESHSETVFASCVVLAVIDASYGAYLPTIVVKLQWDLSNTDTLVVVHLGGGGGFLLWMTGDFS